jgi:hypothetical protein
MRKIILLVILAVVFGVAWYVAQRRYPTSRITVAGAGYDVMVFDRSCDGPRMCVAQVMFLTSTEDTLALVHEGKGLLPWIEANAMEPADRGVNLIAVRPGILRLFPPRDAHGLLYGFLGKGDWQYLGQHALSPEIKAALN